MLTTLILHSSCVFYSLAPYVLWEQQFNDLLVKKVIRYFIALLLGFQQTFWATPETTLLGIGLVQYHMGKYHLPHDFQPAIVFSIHTYTHWLCGFYRLFLVPEQVMGVEPTILEPQSSAFTAWLHSTHIFCYIFPLLFSYDMIQLWWQ